MDAGQRLNDRYHTSTSLPLLSQVLCTELQGEKDLLEAQVEELKSIVGRLDGEVKDLSHRERLLVAFPELATMHLTQPQSKALLFISVNAVAFTL